jgi:hypothetical protein
MDTSSDPEKTVTSSSPHDGGEKAVDEPIAEGEEKTIDSTTTSSTSPPPLPPAEAGDRNGPSTSAVESLQRVAEVSTDAPPPLPFSCWDHKLSICIFWFFILAEVCFIPESFYYGLWFGTTLNHGARKIDAITHHSVSY